MSSKSVNVDLQSDGRVFLRPFSTTENGYSVVHGIPEVVNDIQDVQALGRALEAAFARSRAEVLPAIEPSLGADDSEFLTWVGRRTSSDYSRGVRTVNVKTLPDIAANRVFLRPLHNKGARGGFVAIPKAGLEVSYDTPEELGRAVQKTMEHAI